MTNNSKITGTEIPNLDSLEDISSPWLVLKTTWLVLKKLCARQQMSGKNNCGHLPPLSRLPFAGL